jgi:hypothetical protein
MQPAFSIMTQIYTQPFISPMRERPSSYDQRPAHGPDCLRDLHTSDAYSSQHQPYQHTWEPHSPMSEYQKTVFGVPPAKVGDMYQTRPEIRQNQLREQLPSLSSLFGAPTLPQSRPNQSSFSDRHSPVLSAVPPLDARRPATPIHLDRTFEAPYFPRPAATWQYSHNSRPEPVERLGIHVSSRPLDAGVRPESPRYASRYGEAEASRAHEHSGWSSHSQSSRPESFARDASSSFRPHSEHNRHTPHVQQLEPESRPTYPKEQHNPPMTSNYPPTPPSPVAGDSAMAKDGLGPKIWTGTHFLPRFVRQAEVPDEGMCYFYDDGTHCKTVIDGEVVNAHWGVTKAGKPRKRLAIACITCREKKIKCDPDYPRCVQCEKFGRVCKFKNA